jgi:hypothetical protein
MRPDSRPQIPHTHIWWRRGVPSPQSCAYKAHATYQLAATPPIEENQILRSEIGMGGRIRTDELGFGNRLFNRPLT